MESALIISNSEKSVTFYTEMLTNLLCTEIISVASCGEARRLIIEKDFDICVIHAPLPDESGEGLSRFIAGKGISRVVLSVRSVYFEEISSHVEDLGVVTVSRPINVGLFWNTLKMVKAAHASIRAVRTENFRLHNKIEDIRIIDKAKCLLISYQGMTEQEAHKHIERKAMDTRMTRRMIAEEILKVYGS